MNSFVVLSVLAFVATALSYGHESEDNGPASYHYQYAVNDPHTGDKKEQYEHRDGHVVKGAYSFKEADGTVRVVEYVAGPHSGFNALVKRIGHAGHPEHYGKFEGGHGGAAAGGYGGANSHVGVTHWGFHH